MLLSTATFQPLALSFWASWSTPIIVILIAGALLFLLMTKRILAESATYRQMFSMLAGVAIIVAFSVGLMAQLARQSPGVIRVDDRGIESNFGLLRYSNLKKVELQRQPKGSRYLPRLRKDSISVLVLERLSGPHYVLTENEYEVEKIMEALRVALAKE